MLAHSVLTLYSAVKRILLRPPTHQGLPVGPYSAMVPDIERRSFLRHQTSNGSRPPYELLRRKEHDRDRGDTEVIESPKLWMQRRRKI